MILLVCGHQRSGTTLLRTLLDRHPDITLTNELGNYVRVDTSYVSHFLYILRRLRAVNSKWAFLSRHAGKRGKYFFNALFVMKYLFYLSITERSFVDLNAIGRAMHRMYPGVSYIGDKWPGYMNTMEKLIDSGEPNICVIYRDCRDVVSSSLEQAETSWSGISFGEVMNSAEKVAARWVKFIEIMNLYREKIHIIRYENLVTAPEKEFELLGKWLDLDPFGFSSESVRDTSIGKFKRGLTEKELSTVLEIAGEAMAELRYM